MFKEVQKRVWKTANEKGWHEIDRSFAEYIVLMHSELSEALEEYRNHHSPDEIYEKDGKPEGIPIELADVVIRVLECAETFGIDLDEAMMIKMKYNDTRPIRHGGKKL